MCGFTPTVCAPSRRVEKLEASQKQANSVSGDGASTVCLAELKAKIMQLEGRLEKQEGQLGQQAQHLAQERCSGRGGPALEKQVSLGNRQCYLWVVSSSGAMGAVA
eukprot:scaffold1066_cov16-Tisochrysis_lutea.AAC.1